MDLSSFLEYTSLRLFFLALLLHEHISYLFEILHILLVEFAQNTTGNLCSSCIILRWVLVGDQLVKFFQPHKERVVRLGY